MCEYIFIYTHQISTLKKKFPLISIVLYMEINLGNSVIQLTLIHVDRVIHIDLRVKFLAVRPCWSCFRSTSCLSSLWYNMFLCLNTALR